MQDSAVVITALLTMVSGLATAAFKFLLDDRKRLLDELKESNIAKTAALATAAELGTKAPELQKQLMDVVMENIRLHQQLDAVTK